MGALLLFSCLFLYLVLTKYFHVKACFTELETGNAAVKQLFVRICRTEQLTDYFLHIAVYTYQAAKLNVIVHKLFPPGRTFSKDPHAIHLDPTRNAHLSIETENMI